MEVSKADLYNKFDKIADSQLRYEYLLDKAKTMDVLAEKNKAIFYAGRVETKTGIVTATQMAENHADGTSEFVTAFTKNVPDLWKTKIIFWSIGLPQFRNNPNVTHINIGEGD